MAAGGWGGMAGGAWGGGNAAPSKPSFTEDVEAPPTVAASAPQPSQNSGFGGAFRSAFSKREVQEEEAPAPQPLFGGAGGAYSSAAAGSSSNTFGQSGGSLTEAELKKKEAELKKKEQELKKLETELQASGKLKKKNWPICYPILYHNIAEDIPEKSRRVVRESYMAWWGLVLCLCMNLFNASVMLGYDVDQKIASWFLAVIYWAAGIPLSFWLWYTRIYNGAMKDATFGFLTFFLWFAVHTAFCIWAAIAVPFSSEKWSFSGFVTAIQAFDVGPFPGIIYFIGAGLWTAEAVWSFWIIKDVYFFFRGQGGVEQAKQEAAVAAFKATMK